MFEKQSNDQWGIIKKIGVMIAVLIGTICVTIWLVVVSLPIASVLPLQKFSIDNSLVLGNLGLKQEFSFSLWVFAVENNSDWSAILDYRHSATKSFAFHQKEGENNLFAFGVHAANGVHGTYVHLTPNRWQHVALVKSRSRLAIYVDGIKASEKSFDGGFDVAYAGDEMLTINGWGYGGRRWLGSVSCVRVFDYPLPHFFIKLLARDRGCIPH